MHCLKYQGILDVPTNIGNFGKKKKIGRYKKFKWKKKRKKKKRKNLATHYPSSPVTTTSLQCYCRWLVCLLSFFFWNCPPRSPPPTFSLLFLFLVLCPPLLTFQLFYFVRFGMFGHGFYFILFFYYLSTSVWLVGVSKVFYICYYLLFNCNCLVLLL